MMFVIFFLCHEVGCKSPAMEPHACGKALRHVMHTKGKAVTEFVSDASRSVAKLISM